MHEIPLDVRLLGPLELERDQRLLPLPPSRKARALLAYLAATHRPHGREHLCDLLWPGPADPRAALRGALTKLRRLIDDDGSTRLLCHRDQVAFDANGARVDVTEVQRRAARREECDTESLRQASALFRGDFLEGLDLPRCYRFDAWCAAERETARRTRSTILSTLTTRLRDRPAQALEFARQRLLLDPASEEAHLDIIHLLTELGHKDAALEQYETCRRILRAELGVPPSAELEAVRRRIRPLARADMPRRQTRIRASPTHPALVGRERELEAVRETIDGARTGQTGSVALLVGEAGSGKTRLLEEIAMMASETGGAVLSGRAFEAETVRPFGAWIEMLRSIPSEEIPMELRSDLAPLLPELGEATTASPDRTRLFDAVVRLLASRSERERPLLLLLDDLQAIDQASAALLHFALRAAPVGLLVVCAGRSGEMQDNRAAPGLLRALAGIGELREIQLTPLDAEATEQLVRSVAPGLDAREVHAQSQGNPLFAIELARAGGVSRGALPATLEGVIEGRLSKLGASARTLIPWAASLGRHFHLQVLERVTQMPAADLLLALEELEKRHVLQAETEGYRFTHDLVRQAAYRQITEPRRRLIHARIARVLRESGDPDAEVAGDVAHHAVLAGDRELAARACLAAARCALWKFAPEEAAELATRGIAQLEGLAPEVRLPLHVELLGFSVYPGMKEHRRPDLEGELSRVLREARAADLRADVCRGFQLISYIHFLSGDFDGALDRSLLAQEVGRAGDPVTVVRAIGDTARCLGILDRDMSRAERLAREARSLAAGIGYEGHELPQALGLVHHHAGRWDEAVGELERAAHLARKERERWFECISLARLVMIDLERGRPSDATSRCEQLMSVAAGLDEGSDAPFAEALAALARAGGAGADDLVSVDGALAGLRRADSRWMIAYVQNCAAEMDMRAGRLDAASRRLEEALEAAELVERWNEVAVARALLARLALGRGDERTYRQHLAAVQPDLEEGVLSRRARNAVEAARTDRVEREPEVDTTEP